MNAHIYDNRVCALGEGPLWHPERQQLFWFDILGKRLLSRDGETPLDWQFDAHVSAAGWIDRTTLLIASEVELFTFDLDTGTCRHICPLEADNPVTRSNDGRADPWGGFWIGTMGKEMEPGAGAIYRWYRGALRQLYPGITVSNSICFCPHRKYAYYTDTLARVIMRQPLDAASGWPSGAPKAFVDLTPDRLNPDGAVVDSDGVLWSAQWGASRVAAYGPDGRFLRSVPVDAVQTSCPAFGGPGLDTLYCTSAATGLSPDRLDRQPTNGMTFAAPGLARGQAEHRVVLDG